MKRLLVILLVIITALPVGAYPFDTKYYNHWKAVYHPHNELSYQHAYCSMHNGIEEYELSDKTRVDCLTDTYAIEFDFCNKAYEAVGQSLHYALMTGKKPKIVLILDSKYKQQQMVYVERIKKIGQTYGIEVEYVSDEILNIDNKGRCQFKDCKCLNPKCKCHKPKN
ncbi:MAG: hypothetical protein ACI4S3_04555 [Candidatus Gastranaerophilaceae bacterium]